MTWDASDGYVVLFGALPVGASNVLQSDMWSYSNGNWSELHPAILPQFCWGSVLAYDSIDGYVLYFGGPDTGYGSPTCSSANQTWSYHAGVWSRLHPATSPAPLAWEALTNDSADGYMLLFGGERGSGCAPAGYCGATWKFVGGNWTQLSPVSSPSARAESGFAYDVADGYALLFGGVNQSGPLNDTWKFVGGNWTKLHPTLTPPTPVPDALSYDTSDHEIVYNTARNYSGNVPEIGWTYRSGNWSAITSAAPMQRLNMMSADDPHDGYELLFGGQSIYGLQDTWSIHAGVWTNRTPPAPSSRFYAATAYDASTSKYTLFGGLVNVGTSVTEANDTWTFSTAGWTRLNPTSSPPARYWSSLVYDAHDGYLLLYGGWGATAGLNDTWEYTAGSWTKITPTVGPPRGGFWSEAVYDGADGYVLLAVGSVGHVWTWTYSGGVWTNRTATAGTAPPAPTPNPLVYDSGDGAVLWFGTSTSTTTNETWSFHGGKWTNLTKTVVGAPPPTTGAALADFPAGGYVLLQEGNSQNNSWAYSNGTWTPLFAATGPSPRMYAAMAYDPPGLEDVLFGGSASACDSTFSGYCADTWVWSSSGPVVPYVRSFTAQPATTDLGNTSTLTVVAAGGVAPLSYAYSGLPPGCTSANRSTVSCAPTATGTFQVQVAVTDSAAHVATASTTLAVNVALGAASLAASPNPVKLGGTLTLTTSSSGGTTPYSYVYSGLPTGCTSQTVPSLPCHPNASGNWTVKVALTDAVGQSASSSVRVTVGAAGASGTPAISAFGAYPPAIILGNETNFTVTATGGTGPLTYVYSGLPTGCASANQTKLGCQPISAGVFSVRVNVTDAHGARSSVTTNLTVYPVGGGAGLTVTGFGASPAKFQLGSSTVLAVIASGGVGPIGYAYTGLPPGCAASNRSLLPCAPTSTGNYTVYATVFDSATHRAGVRTALEVLPSSVGPGPLVSRFLLSPANVTLGATVTVVATVAGGTLPLSFSYSGLPSGCSNQNASVFACTPTVSGNFTVVVHVADAVGRTAAAHANLSVAPNPVVHPPSSRGGSVSVLETPAVLVGTFAGGLVFTLVLAFLVERRRRQRREARELVDALSSVTDETPPDELGA